MSIDQFIYCIILSEYEFAFLLSLQNLTEFFTCQI